MYIPNMKIDSQNQFTGNTLVLVSRSLFFCATIFLIPIDIGYTTCKKLSINIYELLYICVHIIQNSIKKPKGN